MIFVALAMLAGLWLLSWWTEDKPRGFDWTEGER
jgi:hypothetical protein